MAGPAPMFDPDRMTGVPRTADVPRMVTVSQLNALVKRVLADHLPGTIHLVGEISNCTRSASGHLYLTLKDEQAEIRCVMWRSAAATLRFKVQDGQEVVATGHVDVYPPRGQYQFQIQKLEPKGAGALDLAFRQLRERLAGEGLFDPARKKPIPRYPRCIAVVTSETGAAIRDILKTLHRRFPCVRVLLHPTRVQGEGAAEEIAAAIARLNDRAAVLGGIDVMIVGRGGGSLEDLWAFNEEVVARAIVASRIPIISAVGHEVDVTIADLVADLRAPTPTAAAELAVPVLDEVIDSLEAAARQIQRTVRHRLELAASRLETIARSGWLRTPEVLLHPQGQRVDEAARRLELALAQRLARGHQQLRRGESKLAAMHPSIVLRRQSMRLGQAGYRLRSAAIERFRQLERRLERSHRDLVSLAPKRRIEIETARVRQAVDRLDRSVPRLLATARQRIADLRARLEATGYRQTLARGYSITRSAADRRIVRHPWEVAPGDGIITETHEGEFTSEVTDAPERHAGPQHTDD